jgi:hypothetical protein
MPAIRQDLLGIGRHFSFEADAPSAHPMTHENESCRFQVAGFRLGITYFRFLACSLKPETCNLKPILEQKI